MEHVYWLPDSRWQSLILKNVAHCLHIFIVILHCVVLNTLALECMLQNLTGPLPVEPDGCAFHSIFNNTDQKNLAPMNPNGKRSAVSLPTLEQR